jgi:hypothetical protein
MSLSTNKSTGLGLLILVFALFARGAAFAQGIPQAKPAGVGLSSERLERITQLLRDDIGKGAMPGAVLRLVARHQSPRQRAHYKSIVRDMVYAAVVQ